MINVITHDSLQQISNPDFLRYCQRYADIERQTLTAIESYGLDFDRSTQRQQRRSDLIAQLRDAGATFANNDNSIHINWLSSACSACRTGEGSYTTFLSLKCHRDCYFCFNPNQENYDYYNQNKRDACGEIGQLAQMSAPLTHVALTGGEPLLHKAECVAFFDLLQHEMPSVHSRLYTAGDPLDRATAIKLQQAGLREIRFSIKIDDSQEKQQKVLKRIAIAREYIPNVMVEMPVLPGTKRQMCNLLLALDDIGIDGINLLEFCFPLNNADDYQQRGFTLKYPPYEVFYNYWYAGSLAIAQSEELCLELLLFAQQNKLRLGVHYCSLANKHSGQVYQQNFGYPANDTLIFSPIDYFFKTAKVFGQQDMARVSAVLQQHELPFSQNLLHNFIQFNPLSIQHLVAFDLEICLSSLIVEQDETEAYFIKEVQVAKTTPAIFESTDVLGA